MEPMFLPEVEASPKPSAYFDLIAQTQNDAAGAENQYRLSLSTDPNYTPAIFSH